MAIKKKDGEFFKTRNSNHKYKDLDDLDRLKELRLKHSRAEVAKIYNVPPNSIRDTELRHFTDEERDSFIYDRERHQNRRITVVK